MTEQKCQQPDEQSEGSSVYQPDQYCRPQGTEEIPAAFFPGERIIIAPGCTAVFLGLFPAAVAYRLRQEQTPLPDICHISDDPSVIIVILLLHLFAPSYR